MQMRIRHSDGLNEIQPNRYDGLLSLCQLLIKKMSDGEDVSVCDHFTWHKEARSFPMSDDLTWEDLKSERNTSLNEASDGQNNATCVLEF